jgi:hypothetical protein
MLKAQIHSKVPTQITDLEDILTSDVFSFFYYSNRQVFLFDFLNKIGLSISKYDSTMAEFQFWPRYEEHTEPDLVIIVGNYYILIEAKYMSDFGKGSDKTKPQLIREIEAGMIEAHNIGKQFVLLAITKDPYKKTDKFISVQKDKNLTINWFSWQKISEMLIDLLKSDESIDKRDRLFATDLLTVLDKKNLRKYQNLQKVLKSTKKINPIKQIFIKAETIEFRGDFIGFSNSIIISNKLKPFKTVFLQNIASSYFSNRQNQKPIKETGKILFFQQ